MKAIPDILTPREIERILAATRKSCYRIFLLTSYSMGLRLEEALSLQVGDIDGERKLVHIRRGKGHKDMLVPVPDRTLHALRLYWLEHRYPTMLFPNRKGLTCRYPILWPPLLCRMNYDPWPGAIKKLSTASCFLHCDIS